MITKENKSYTELLVWKEARALVNIIYSLTKLFPKDELFGLTNQLRRAAVSVPSNIAEGCGRETPRDTTHFLVIARGSLYEIETQLYLALDQKYLNANDFELAYRVLCNCRKLLQGFIKHHKSRIENRP